MPDHDDEGATAASDTYSGNDDSGDASGDDANDQDGATATSSTYSGDGDDTSDDSSDDDPETDESVDLADA